jgi:hypothetical protein
MLAIIAAILFGIAWIINATGTATNAWFSVTDLLLLGLLPGPASGRHRKRPGKAPVAHRADKARRSTGSNTRACYQ